MIAAAPFSFAAPALLWVGLALSAAAVVVAWLKRPAVPGRGMAFFGAGLLLIALAAGGLVWHAPVEGEVIVLVDLSPSTRTATFRQRPALEQRARQLLGSTPYRMLAFAGGEARPLPEELHLSDIPCEHTTLNPPPAQRLLVFTDGRFDPLPAALPPTWIVADPDLEHPADAAIARLEARGPDVVAHVTNAGTPRTLRWDGTGGANHGDAVPNGSIVLGHPIRPGAPLVSAALNAGDAWPENDAAWLAPPPPVQRRRWWVSATAPLADQYVALKPADLPSDAGTYLGASLVVLDNLPASALSDAQQQALRQYANDLGGAVLILGGDAAFGAGQYVGTPLDAISPLASAPPEPTTHWVLLVDGSGSMAESTRGGATRWHLASGAVARLLPALPPQDVVTAGSFARDVTWWSSDRSARATATLPLPPPDIQPYGPTNLDAALRQIAAGVGEHGLRRELLLVTDADADLADPNQLAAAMRAKDIHLHVLAIGNGKALPALRQIANDTGGTATEQLDPARWASSVRELARGITPPPLLRTAADMRWLPPLTQRSRSVSTWDRVWLKSGATLLADAAAAGGQRVPMAARWPVGSGEVAAIGFATTGPETAALADLIARRPRDPRFAVTWDIGSSLRVTIDAVDGLTYLNGLQLELELRDTSDPSQAVAQSAVPQVGPGRYQTLLPAPRAASFATVRVRGGAVIDQASIAARHAAEFDAIGNDHQAMRRIATASGGAVVDALQQEPIDFHWPPRQVPLCSWLAVAGAACIAAGLAWWRVS